MNESGQVAFSAGLSGTTSSPALFRGDGTTLVEIAHAGQTIPGGGAAFRGSWYHFYIADSGEVLFFDSVRTTNGDFRSGIFSGSGSQLSRVAYYGDPTPSGDTTFSSVTAGGRFVINDKGDIAFRATLAAGGSGLFGRFDGELVEIVRQGQQVPGSTDTFGLFMLPPSINGVGQAAFYGQISGGNEGGVFVWDQSEGIRTLLRTGDQLFESTVEVIRFDDGLSPWEARPLFNDLGQVVFWFELADNRSGYAMLTIPEPAGAGVLAFVSLAVLRRRD